MEPLIKFKNKSVAPFCPVLVIKQVCTQKRHASIIFRKKKVFYSKINSNPLNYEKKMGYKMAKTFFSEISINTYSFFFIKKNYFHFHFTYGNRQENLQKTLTSRILPIVGGKKSRGKGTGAQGIPYQIRTTMMTTVT